MSRGRKIATGKFFGTGMIRSCLFRFYRFIYGNTANEVIIQYASSAYACRSLIGNGSIILSSTIDCFEIVGSSFIINLADFMVYEHGKHFAKAVNQLVRLRKLRERIPEYLPFI